MTLWLLEPHDPLIARDGRPFGADPGAVARSLPLPYPGTMAGTWRTRAGQDADGFFAADPEAMRQVAVAGPVLATIADDGAIELAAPAPADAVLFDAADGPVVRRLRPISPGDALLSLPAGLQPLGLGEDAPPGKPMKGAPAFWAWSAFERWLLEPREGRWQASDGVAGPVPERRTHVAITAGTSTAAEGALFGTEGRRFFNAAGKYQYRRLALAVEVTGEAAARPGVMPVGGERRLAAWRPAGVAWPAPPEALIERIVADRACRLVLLTPGVFAGAWRPGAGLAREGVATSVRAAAVGRPQVVSGWDLAADSAKPTRRLAPAGSVYHLALEGAPEAIAAWVRATWMRCVSDDPQDARDGYGLAALGAWRPEA